MVWPREPRPQPSSHGTGELCRGGAVLCQLGLPLRPKWALPRVNWLQLPKVLPPWCLVLFLPGSWMDLSPSQNLNGIKVIYSHSEQVVRAGGRGLGLRAPGQGSQQQQPELLSSPGDQVLCEKAAATDPVCSQPGTKWALILVVLVRRLFQLTSLELKRSGNSGNSYST